MSPGAPFHVVCVMRLCQLSVNSAHLGVIPRGRIPHIDCLQGGAEGPQAAPGVSVLHFGHI